MPRPKSAVPPPAAVLSHAFEGTTSRGCEVCTLPIAHAVHRHGEPGREVLVRVVASDLPPEPEGLRYVLGMLTLADSYLTEQRPEAAQQVLRDGIRALRAELGTDSPPDLRAYAERVAAQTARIDSALNEEGRKQRKRR